MTITEIIIIGIGLAMDAFAVAICKGLSIKNTLKDFWKKAIIIALYFGIFQALMPTIGFALGNKFQKIVENVDHWFAFILLSVIGTNMIHESLSENREKINDKVDFKTMLLLAIATSIDAFSVGITFAFLKVNIIIAVVTIGVITFALTLLGVKIGNKFGDIHENIAGILGGTILILIGIKILITHLNII